MSVRKPILKKSHPIIDAINNNQMEVHMSDKLKKLHLAYQILVDSPYNKIQMAINNKFSNESPIFIVEDLESDSDETVHDLFVNQD